MAFRCRVKRTWWKVPSHPANTWTSKVLLRARKLKIRAPANRFIGDRLMELRAKRAPRIDSEITVPGDKSISHRTVIIAALSNGVCHLRGFLPSEDCMHTVNALRALGIQIDQPNPDEL